MSFWNVELSLFAGTKADHVMLWLTLSIFLRVYSVGNKAQKWSYFGRGACICVTTRDWAWERTSVVQVRAVLLIGGSYQSSRITRSWQASRTFVLSDTQSLTVSHEPLPRYDHDAPCCQRDLRLKVPCFGGLEVRVENLHRVIPLNFGSELYVVFVAHPKNMPFSSKNVRFKIYEVV